MSFARCTSVTPGQLHDELVEAALPRHDRFGDAELVDAPLDRLQRLRHRLLAQLVPDVGLHHVGIAAAGARLAIEDRIGLDRGGAESLVVLDALDHELSRVGGFEARDDDAGRGQRLAQPLDGGVRLQPQRIVGLDAEDQVDTALEVETELDLLFGRVEREDRERDDAENDGDFPAKILVHGSSSGGTRDPPRYSASGGSESAPYVWLPSTGATGSWPWYPTTAARETSMRTLSAICSWSD